MVLTAGCAVQTEETSGGGEEIHMTEDGEYYTFQDVEGNSYEAPLLSDVPQCTYDFDHLKTDETIGYKSFKDEENGVTARLGIDVSEFQGEEIDWKQVKDSGVEFVIIRLGYRAYGDSGELVLDAMYEQNIQGALEAGLDVGVYFFSQAVNAAEAVEEAEFVLDHLSPYEITGFCKVFCDTVEHAGYESMIYSNMKWMAFTLDMSELSEYDFWYADYHEIPQCPYDYKIWQYSEEGVVPGINANVDLNLWFEKEEKSK